jgi:aspartate kinase
MDPDPIVVMHIDATAVADGAAIKETARRLVAAAGPGQRVVGVVSASAAATHDLVSLAHAVSPRPDARELDMLLAVAEQVACALLAIAISELGSDAESLTGAQAGIRTTNEHGRATIVEVRPRRVEQALADGRIPLVTGSQGAAPTGEITTLAEGSAESTAAALAAALGAPAVLKAISSCARVSRQTRAARHRRARRRALPSATTSASGSWAGRPR